MHRLLIVVVAALALPPVFAVAQDETGTPAASPVASPEASDVGRAVRWGDWTVTVEGAEFAETVEPGTAWAERARGRWLVVRLTVVNETRAPLDFPDDDARARDAEGRTFTVDTRGTLALLLGDERLTYLGLQPGIPYGLALVFDVAPDAEGFALLLLGTGDLALDLGV